MKNRSRRAFNPSRRDSAYIAALMQDVPKDAEDRDWKRQCKAGNIDRVLEHADEFGIDAADRKHLREARERFRNA